MTDPKFEEMCSPDKYPLGKKGIIAQRPRQITPRKYFNQRILDVDGRFAKDIEYLFVAQYTVEAKQVMDDTTTSFLDNAQQDKRMDRSLMLVS